MADFTHKKDYLKILERIRRDNDWKTIIEKYQWEMFKDTK